jgi:diguanylate cyclase (GGDEF)-like protein/PAS domain S-box-containing protein
LDDFDLFREDDAALSAALLTQTSLIDTQHRLGAMLEAMPMGLIIHTEQGILFANKHACLLLQMERAGLVGQHLLDHIPQADNEKVATQLRNSFDDRGEPLEQECLINRPDGTQRAIKLVTGLLPWDGNPVIQVIMQDVTDQKRAEHSLRQLTITDELTGAYNRRHLLYESALYMGEESAFIPLSVALIDIDHFKRINDTYGHASGDIALKELTLLANRFIPTIRGTDSAIFARIGGEEFVLLLPGLSETEAVEVAECFRSAVQKLQIQAIQKTLSFTVSIGVSGHHRDDPNFHTALARADAALYIAKSEGRNCVRKAQSDGC